MKSRVVLLCVGVVLNCWTSQLMAQAVVPGFVVETYAELPRPCIMDFDAATGYLYVGWEERPTTLEFMVRRVGPGGGSVEEYGVSALRDPDSVLFDTHGTISGTPGSLLVGANGGNLFAIRPDQTVQTLYAGATVFQNPGTMIFLPSGNVIMADQGTNTIVELGGGWANTLFEVPNLPWDIAISPSSEFYVYSLGDGITRVYSTTGALLNDNFTSARTSYGPMAFGAGGAWGYDLYAISGGELLRLDADGMATVMGSGFDMDTLDIVFHDGALYVSENQEGRILRVVPEPGALSLFAIGLGAMTLRTRRRGRRRRLGGQ
ncbi:MAG TPA: PEP-CTERM sorting domain-containing protein [Phycisphaerae bacterium]|nr:PEP-CTERM sorting domain-containing protein [Phycisphaerae bacterium]